MEILAAILLTAVIWIWLGWLFYKYVYIGFANRYVAKHHGVKTIKVRNQTSVIAERGGVATIIPLGSDIMVGGNDLTKIEPGDTDLDVIPRTPDNAPQNGGTRTPIAEWFNNYIRRITGEETNIQSFRDLFTSSTTFLQYDLKRPYLVEHRWKDKTGEDVSWWVMKFKEADMTWEIRHNRESFDFLLPPTETGKLMPSMNPDGSSATARQRIPVALKCQVFVRVSNAGKAIYKTGRNYLGFVLNVLISEMRDQVQGKEYDDLLALDARTELAKKILEADAIKNLKSEIGIEVLDIQIEDIFITDDTLRTAVQDLGKQFAKGQAEIAAEQFALQKAKLTKQKDFELAEGQAAYGKKRLEGLAEGARAIHGVLRNHELTRDVVVADSYSESVKNAKHGTIYVTPGGRGPMPVVDLTPDEGKEGGK